MKLCFSFFLAFMHVLVPINPELSFIFFTKLDCQALELNSNRMGKENEYTFANLFEAENYKKWARKMIFALKNLVLLGYVDSTIIRLTLQVEKEKK